MRGEIIIGIRNEHNDCYINSVVQCLSSFPLIRSYFNAHNHLLSFHNRNSVSKGEITRELASLVSQLRRSPGFRASEVILPSCKALKATLERYSAFPFGRHQQDAHEFLILLLNLLHDEMRIESSSFISRNFEGKQFSTLTCQFCGFESLREESFYELTLEVGEMQVGLVHLRDLLGSYLTPEPVEWTCSKCRKTGSASKKIDISHFPRVLIFHLSRYLTNRGTEKNLSHVEYDFQLDLRAYSALGAKYQLLSVCNHYGGLQNGHYTAYVYSKDDLKWFKADDAVVEEINFLDVVSNASSILFYNQLNN